MDDQDDREKAQRNYIVWLLGRRDYSRAQLEEKLRKREVEPELVKKIIDELKDEGVFKEDAYSRARLRQLLKRGLGSSMLKYKLQSEKCKVTDADVARAYDEVGTDPYTELKRLVEKTVRRMSRRSRLTDEEILEKSARFLVSKGHSYTKVLPLLKEELKALKD